eukprot:2846499-Prymnesium_polylepis.1
MSFIGRRFRELLGPLRVRGNTGTHSDAKGRAARDFPVPRSNFCRAATTSRGDKKLSTFEPTRHRNRSKAFFTGVRPYERTPWPVRQPDLTKWCHGLPSGHAWRQGSLHRTPTDRMAESAAELADGHLPFAPLVPGSHRAGPGDPGGALHGRTAPMDGRTESPARKRGSQLERGRRGPRRRALR